MKKKKLRIIKFISVLLLIFSFNLNVNAETTKIYYADENGFRKVAETAPEGFTKNEGGVEVTGSALSALGTIKWYKDGGTTAVATGATYTIGAGDITNKATFSAQLEG